MKTLPHFEFENTYWRNGFEVVGIDEAGRGAFAGPLAVGGVVIPQKFETKFLDMGINDSKLLSEKKREVLYEEIKKNAVFSYVEFVDIETINSFGIGKATTFGMQQIHKKVNEMYYKTFLLIDAFKIPDIVTQKAIVHGDRVSISIAAASILAKVERDRYMKNLSRAHSQYGWEKNKGYGTLDHRKAIQSFGLSDLHRTAFCRKLFV